VSRQLALEAQGLGKSYVRPSSPLMRLGAGLGLVRAEERWAVRDIDFQLERGAALGVIGPNGAGKSSLLRVLSGATAPSAGRYRTSGRVASLLELGAGFHPDFSGRENVLMNGVLLGRSRHEMRSRMDAILDFAELQHVADDPVRTYSTGMAMRLGFATALGTEPEMLLLDEVFAVGDLAFQKKCVDRLFDFKNSGGTLLFCSHSLYDVRQMCDNVLWLEGGRSAGYGPAAVVTNDYAAFQRTPYDPASTSTASDSPHIVDARFFGTLTDEPIDGLNSGDAVELRVWWRNPHASAEPVHIGVTFTRHDATLVTGLGTHISGEPLVGESGCCTLHLPCVELLAGTYRVSAMLFDARGIHRHHEFALRVPLVITNDTREVGLVRLWHAWGEREDLALPHPHIGAGEARSLEGSTS
jgi:ABC-type polysaccharide/polyol phosphate transport system ATPase subunit